MGSKLIIGDVSTPTFLFEDGELFDLVVNTSSDVIGDELSIDTLEANVQCQNKNIIDLIYGTEVTYVNSNDVVMTFYLKSIKRVGTDRYEINAHSLIGMLDNEMFYGNVYTNKPFPELISDIIKTDSLQPFRPLEYLRINNYATFGDLCGDRFGLTSTVTMRDSFKFKFRFNGFQAGSDAASSTSWTACICGTFSTSSTQSIRNCRYGIAATFTRSSTSAAWQTTAAFTFYYQSQSINIGTPQIGDIWEIEAIPTQGKLIVNGVEYSFTGVSSDNNVVTPMTVVGGGAYLTLSNGKVIGQEDYHDIKHDVFEWKVVSETGEVKVDCTPLYNTEDQQVYVRQTPNGQQANSYCADDSNPQFKESGNSIPGAIYYNYRQDVLDKITYSAIASNMQINGWLPILTKREALHYLLMSTGIIIKKDDHGGLIFTEPIDLEFPILDSAIYMEGDVEYFQKVNEIQIEEHAFISTKPTTLYPEPTETIFEGPATAGDVQVCEFEKAPSELDGWATTYDAAGLFGICANAVLLTGTGQVTILGFPYKHQTTIMSKRISNRPDGGVASVRGLPLITAANSDNVMDRMTEYYGSAHKANLSIVKSDEMCGNKYSFTNPFYEQDSGFITRMSERVSAITKADCEILCNYTGSSVGEGYTDFVVLEGSGTWDVPASVFEKDNPQIRVYLIGGGSGGFSGLAGENGKVNGQGQFQPRAKGGSVGSSGAGGKVYSVTLTNPAATLSYSCGTGGEGGAISYSTEDSNAGTDGTATTLTAGGQTYTSNSGTSTPEGIANVFNNERYAMDFPTALNNWGREELDGSDYAVGVGVGGYGGYFTEEGGLFYYHQARKVIGVNFNADVVNGGAFGGWGNNNGVTGGGGGGAGYGQAGSAGTASTSSKAGNGGNGGNATAVPPKVTDWRPRLFGVGGCGGGGGGAGGNSGIVYASGKSAGSAGTGGYGGKGGTGGDGCVLIYY